MNFEESDSYKEKIEINDRRRKAVALMIVFCAFAIVIIAILIYIIKKQDAVTFKAFVDSKRINNLPAGLYTEENGDKYVSVSKFASLLNEYKYTSGEYGSDEENEQACTLQGTFEIISLKVDALQYTKYIDFSNEKPKELAGKPVTTQLPAGYSESFQLEKPIKYINGEIHIALEYIPEMFNVKIDWSNKYRLRINTLDYVVKNGLNILARQKQYTNINYDYENLKAMLKDKTIVGISESTWGVYSLLTNKEILGTRYKKIQYVQNADEFLITSDNGKMGVALADGKFLIPFAAGYDELKLIDQINRLYSIRIGSEYGVINGVGEVIIHPEYDKIGIDLGRYNTDDSKAIVNNSSLLLNKFIPIYKKDGGIGLYNLEGKLVLNNKYELGYISKEPASAGYKRSVLVIPEEAGVSGIVVKRDEFYGIFSEKEESLYIPCVCSKIYSIRNSGEVTYYIEYNGQEMTLKDFLARNQESQPQYQPITTEYPEQMTEETTPDTETTENTNTTVENTTTENTNTTSDSQSTTNTTTENSNTTLVTTNSTTPNETENTNTAEQQPAEITE